MTTSSYEARVGALSKTTHRIDLRSDTVTIPTPAMREAMYHAEVGDDVYGEDPTVNRLEELAARDARQGGRALRRLRHDGQRHRDPHALPARRRGRLAAIARTSFSMRSAARRGSTALHRALPDAARRHTRPREAGRIVPRRRRARGADRAALPGGHPQHVRRPRALRRRHCTSWPPPRARASCPVHMDGARIFNAAIALGIPVAALAAEVDSVMFCLSKGLERPGRLACSSDRLTSSPRRAACASCSAAGCARRELSPRQASSR